MTITEHIREHILLVLYDNHYRLMLKKKNITQNDMYIQSCFPFTIQLAKKWQWVDEFQEATTISEIDQTEFFQKCLNRMWQGKFRYCLIEHINPSLINKLKLLNTIEKKYEKYHCTRNLENLCDAYNFTMILYYMNKLYINTWDNDLHSLKKLLYYSYDIEPITKFIVFDDLLDKNINWLKKTINCKKLPVFNTDILITIGIILSLEYNYPSFNDIYFKSINDSERKGIILEK